MFDGNCAIRLIITVCVCSPPFALPGFWLGFFQYTYFRCHGKTYPTIDRFLDCFCLLQVRQPVSSFNFWGISNTEVKLYGLAMADIIFKLNCSMRFNSEPSSVWYFKHNASSVTFRTSFPSQWRYFMVYLTFSGTWAYRACERAQNSSQSVTYTIERGLVQQDAARKYTILECSLNVLVWLRDLVQFGLLVCFRVVSSSHCPTYFWTIFFASLTFSIPLRRPPYKKMCTYSIRCPTSSAPLIIRTVVSHHALRFDSIIAQVRGDEE